MPASTAPVAWIDVETSTLSPHTGDLLEVAALVTTGSDYTPVDDGITVTIHPERFAHLRGPEAVEAMKPAMLPLVIDMHTDTGLFTEIAQERTVDLAQADRRLRDYLAQHFDARGAVMGGNSISLDRDFLGAYAPRTYEHLHYRSLDCTSASELVRRLPWISDDLTCKPAIEGTEHRAMADVHRSIAQARMLSELLHPLGVPRRMLRGAWQSVRSVGR